MARFTQGPHRDLSPPLTLPGDNQLSCGADVSAGDKPRAPERRPGKNGSVARPAKELFSVPLMHADGVYRRSRCQGLDAEQRPAGRTHPPGERAAPAPEVAKLEHPVSDGTNHTPCLCVRVRIVCFRFLQMILLYVVADKTAAGESVHSN